MIKAYIHPSVCGFVSAILLELAIAIMAAVIYNKPDGHESEEKGRKDIESEQEIFSHDCGKA